MKNYSTQIIRAVRKYHEIKQTDFAPIIQTTQSALSKIEAGLLEVSAIQWLAVCEKFVLDPRCLFTGKIENLGERKLKVDDHSRIGGFKIPKDYSYLMGSSVRTAYPLLKFANLKLGEKRFESFIKSTGFDRDYFMIMNNPLNLKFIENLVLFLMGEGLISLDNVDSIIDVSKFKDVHSSIILDFYPDQSIEVAVKKLLQRVKFSYEQNTNYEFVGDKEFVIAKDQDFVKEFKLSSEFNDFRQKFNLSHFQGLDNFVSNGSSKFKSKQINGGWVILKAS